MRVVSKFCVCNYEFGIVFVFFLFYEEIDLCDGFKIDDIVLLFIVLVLKYGGSDRLVIGLVMREVLVEFREGFRSVFGENEVEEVEEEEEDEVEVEVEVEGRGEFVVEEEK